MFHSCLKILFFIDSHVEEDFAKVNTIIKGVGSTMLLPLNLFCSKEYDM